MLRKILAVDDSALIHQMYKLFLSRYKNCKLVSAMNGLEALDKLAQEDDIDLVLLDINMPEMDGWETLRLIRCDEELTGLPVVMFSVKGEIRDKIESLQEGADDFVTKPFIVDDLIKRVGKVLAGAVNPVGGAQ